MGPSLRESDVGLPTTVTSGAADRGKAKEHHCPGSGLRNRAHGRAYQLAARDRARREEIEIISASETIGLDGQSAGSDPERRDRKIQKASARPKQSQLLLLVVDPARLNRENAVSIRTGVGDVVVGIGSNRRRRT
jgi:hypothetical protein